MGLGLSLICQLTSKDIKHHLKEGRTAQLSPLSIAIAQLPPMHSFSSGKLHACYCPCPVQVWESRWLSWLLSCLSYLPHAVQVSCLFYPLLYFSCLPCAIQLSCLPFPFSVTSMCIGCSPGQLFPLYSPGQFTMSSHFMSLVNANSFWI